MRRLQIYIGVGVGALSACVETPPKPTEATQLSASKPLFEAPTATPTAEPAKPAAKPNCKAGMVAVPAGTFTMGDNVNTEKAGKVTVESFCMDRTEVTTAAYAACVKDGKCTAARSFVGTYCNAGFAGRENHPITCVNWDQATAYCAAQGQRLPTEEEWEYAARGTDGRIYPWGNEEPKDQLCWNGKGNDLGHGKRSSTCAVGSHPKDISPFGVVDMAGNAAEWMSSASSRGSDWDDSSYANHAAERHGMSPNYSMIDVGFRCARSVGGR